MKTRSEAIETMNNWGAGRIPFLFIIDFEMKSIRLFRIDQPLPDGLFVDFHNSSAQSVPADIKRNLVLKKMPVSYPVYEQAFMEIQKHIAAGNTFLVNLTFPTLVEINLTPEQIFRYSTASYKIFLDGEFICFSPESFVKIKKGIISTYPMKGTISASIPDAGRIITENLKELAEHNTIVDLLRNDLSMIANGITVKRFRYIDRINTHTGEILQVSSEIAGKLPDDYHEHIGDILFTLLPAGSVTGAPKKKTVEIIQNTEKSDRGYYCGIFGIFDGVNVDSAVMIRFIEMRNGRMYFRSGGGITHLSRASDEYAELLEKVYVPIA